MSQCPRCRHENRDKAKFCEECAAPLVARCTNCGTELSPAAKFCSECAHPTGTGSSPPADKFSSPDSYTPRYLAERILTSKAALEGERKHVTVLFADLKGSMELLADRDPEDARKLLDPVLERMMEAVHRYEGTVNQVMGDGIMALFGAPLAHEDHAVRACYAALRMQEAVGRYGDEAQRRFGVPIQIRVGLNSGDVVVRSVGSDLRMDYTAVGQTTHLAARMEQIAKPGSILMTADALRLAEGYIAVKSLGPVPVKGLSDPVDVYELTGATGARTRMQASAARGLTRFVGRAAETDQLARALGLTAEGRGQVVAVVGEAGVGKSRLLYEFTRSHHTHGWLVLEGSSVSYGKATSYLPVIDLLRTYFNIQDGDDQRKIREKVSGKVLTLDEALKSALVPLLALLDVPVDDPQWQILDPPQRRMLTLDALKRLLLRESRVQPLVLVFEDLHWIDAETQALLDTLVDSLPTARVLLLVNFRPEYRSQWGSKTCYSQIRLDALPSQSAEELLDDLLGSAPDLQTLKPLLVRRGNPFFLEETVRTLVETGALVGERGCYRLAKPVQAIRVPPTVQTILAARIDRLSPEEKRLLQTASVIGKDLPFSLLQAIGDLPEDALRRGLTNLQAAEFLYETQLFPDLEHSFKHALTHEVTYASVLQERRRELHARVAAAMEGLSGDRLVEHVERIAHHAFRGELWDRAVALSRQAGAKMLARSANREAVGYFEQALAALSHLSATPAANEQAIDIRFDLRAALTVQGEFTRVLESMVEAERLAMVLGDERRVGWALLYRCNGLMQTGNFAAAIEAGSRAQSVAESLGDATLTIATRFYLGMTYANMVDPRAAMPLLHAVIAALGEDLAGERFGLTGLPSVQARAFQALALCHQGCFAEGAVAADEAITLGKRLRHPFSSAVAYWIAGTVYVVKGDWARATVLLEHGLAHCRDWSLVFAEAGVASWLGYTYAMSNRLADGLALIEVAVERMDAIRYLSGRFWGYWVLAHACALAGRPDNARRAAERASADARELQAPGLEAWARCLRVFIEAGSDQPDVESAERDSVEAIAVATGLGLRPLVARCHAELAKLYRRARKHAEADDHFQTATAMYREMGMQFWLERAEAEMAKLGRSAP